MLSFVDLQFFSLEYNCKICDRDFKARTNSKIESLNPKIESLNPKSESLNPKSESLNPKIHINYMSVHRCSYRIQ